MNFLPQSFWLGAILIFCFVSFYFFTENVKSVCGTLDHIPISCHSEFLNDFVAVMVEYAANAKRCEDQTKYIMKYDLIVAYGRKPQTETK